MNAVIGLVSRWGRLIVSTVNIASVKGFLHNEGAFGGLG